MSKKPRVRVRAEDEPIPGFARGEVSEVVSIIDGISGSSPSTLPHHIMQATAAFADDLLVIAKGGVEDMQCLTPEGWEQFWLFTHYAATQGFSMALYRYAEQLKNVPELATWRRKRDDGGDRGRSTQTRRREQRYAKIRETWAAMEAAGQQPTNQRVAAAVGCGVSTVIRAFKNKPAKRSKR
jgi:hypothetical protein